MDATQNAADEASEIPPMTPFATGRSRHARYAGYSTLVQILAQRP
jgi:hypothetical protein